MENKFMDIINRSKIFRDIYEVGLSIPYVAKKYGFSEEKVNEIFEERLKLQDEWDKIEFKNAIGIAIY